MRSWRLTEGERCIYDCLSSPVMLQTSLLTDRKFLSYNNICVGRKSAITQLRGVAQLARAPGLGTRGSQVRILSPGRDTWILYLFFKKN